MINELRGREAEVLNYIKRKIQQQGFPPTTKQICFDIKIGLPSFKRIIYRLAHKGYLKKLPRGTLNIQMKEI